MKMALPSWLGLRVLGLGLLALSCASGPKPRAENAPPPRLKDSAPERAASQRASARNMNLEEEDQRWGIAAAQERKRQEKQKAEPAATLPTPPAPGPVDLKANPAATP
jgi:hypothetical protein